MQWIKTHPLVSALVALLALGGFAAIISGQNREPTNPTTTVNRGDVSEIVSVSGMVEAVQKVNLSFPNVGVVANVAVARGDTVATGTLLATIGDDVLVAERQRAIANLRQAQATQAELRAGATSETRAVSSTNVANAREALHRTQARAVEDVERAYADLLSNDLEAVARDPETSAPAPTVSGTYTCAEEGTYTLRVYNSSTQSGYSYTLSGLESGSYTVSVDQPAPLGACGLYIQFTDDTFYGNSEWVIQIPNPRSSTYITKQNAYRLARTQAEQNVAAARDAVRLAEDTAEQATAGARVEALLAANAQVQAAQAQIASIDAQLQDVAIYAPFAGTVTDVHIDAGEVARGETAIAMINTGHFELVARIPEIDITRLAEGQVVTTQFDANRAEPVTGYIAYLAPEAIEIDGVGYFEAVIEFQTVPTWMRAGLNADIDIEIARADNVLRLPQRFIEFTDDGSFVAVRTNGTTRRQSVTLGLIGNDGFVEVVDLPADTVIVAP